MLNPSGASRDCGRRRFYILVAARSIRGGLLFVVLVRFVESLNCKLFSESFRVQGVLSVITELAEN